MLKLGSIVRCTKCDNCFEVGDRRLPHWTDKGGIKDREYLKKCPLCQAFTKVIKVPDGKGNLKLL